MYGLPDSWAGWAARRVLQRASGRGGGRRGIARASGPKSYYFDKLILYKPILTAELNTPSGSLWKRLEAKALKTQVEAMRMAGFKTGKLRSSIYLNHRTIPDGQEIKIGSDVDYAYMHHQGTKPHVILPKGDHEFLRFSAGNRIVYTRIVNHPGTKPNRFLAEPMRKNFSDMGTTRVIK
jgi:hypothetical protein